MLEGELVGYKSFVSANECNTGLIVFLYQNIPREVSYSSLVLLATKHPLIPAR